MLEGINPVSYAIDQALRACHLELGRTTHCRAYIEGEAAAPRHGLPQFKAVVDAGVADGGIHREVQHLPEDLGRKTQGCQLLAKAECRSGVGGCRKRPKS